MNNFRKVKLFGLACILTITTTLIGFHLLQAQIETKGKRKPKEEAYWSVIIPDTDDNMLYGMQQSYESNENDWVSIIKLNYTGKKGKGFCYQINFWITPPTQAGFKDVKFDENWKYDQGIPCLFPDDYLLNCAAVPPYCLQCFLNNPHPHPNYYSFRIHFMIFDFDIEGMQVGDKVDLSDYEGHYGFSIWYSSECSPLYHNVAGNFGVPPKSPLSGLFIKRINENTWRIFVDQEMDVEEIYCEEETGKGRKLKRVYRTPVAGKAKFTFQMDWIKHIVQ